MHPRNKVWFVGSWRSEQLLLFALQVSYVPKIDVYSGVLCDALREYDGRRRDNTPLHFLLLPSHCCHTWAGSIAHASCYLECIVLIIFRLAIVWIDNRTRLSTLSWRGTYFCRPGGSLRTCRPISPGRWDGGLLTAAPLFATLSRPQGAPPYWRPLPQHPPRGVRRRVNSNVLYYQPSSFTAL